MSKIKNKDKPSNNDGKPINKQRHPYLALVLYISCGILILAAIGGLYYISFFWQIQQTDSPPPKQFFITSLLSLFVFIAIVVQVIIYARMSAQNERLIKASEDSAEVARDAFRIGNTAHFGIPQIFWHYTGENSRAILYIRFLNGGKTPAWHFHALATMYIGQKCDSTAKKFGLRVMPGNLRQTFIIAGGEIAVGYESVDFQYLSEIRKLFEGNTDQLFITVSATFVNFQGKHQLFDFIAVGGRRMGEDFEDYKAKEHPMFYQPQKTEQERPAKKSRKRKT